MGSSARLAMFALAAVFVSSSVTGALAATQWERHHPRREQVNHRLENQDLRIDRERREGEITPAQARRLHAEDRAIRHEERAMSRFDHGHITPAEQKALNQQENAVSSQIGR